jgi:hypothetical protein
MAAAARDRGAVRYVMSRRTRSRGHRRSYRSRARERDGAGNCQFLDFLAHNCSRAMVEADKEREPKAGSKGGTTNVKRNRRAREAQADGPGRAPRDISATSARGPNKWPWRVPGPTPLPSAPREEDRNVAVPGTCCPALHARRRETAGHVSGGLGSLLAHAAQFFVRWRRGIVNRPRVVL